MANPEVNQAFQNNLKRIRKAADLSQEELARRADMHRTEISLLERGGREPKLSTLIKLAAVLGVSIGDLSQGVSWVPAQKPKLRQQPVGHFRRER